MKPFLDKRELPTNPGVLRQTITDKTYRSIFCGNQNPSELPFYNEYSRKKQEESLNSCYKGTKIYLKKDK